MKRKFPEDSEVSKIQSALEFNTFALKMLDRTRGQLSAAETEHTLIHVWQNLKTLSKMADLAATSGKIVEGEEVLQANTECENGKKGKGVQVDLKSMIIFIDKDVLLYY